jgi:hypothetical protein
LLNGEPKRFPPQASTLIDGTVTAVTGAGGVPRYTLSHSNGRTATVLARILVAGWL